MDYAFSLSDLISIIDFYSLDTIGYIAAGLTIATYSMKTMIPLRLCGICASCLFVTYGLLLPSYPQVVLHAVLLPLNALRLHQMIRLVRQVRDAARNDMSVDWIRPWASSIACRAGELVFAKGEVADSMYYIVSGRFLLEEIDMPMESGQLIGEMGLVVPDRLRTLSFRCIEDGKLLAISYSDVKQLYFQNPQFGFYLVHLIGRRMSANIERLEARMAEGGTRTPD